MTSVRELLAGFLIGLAFESSVADKPTQEPKSAPAPAPAPAKRGDASGLVRELTPEWIRLPAERHGHCVLPFGDGWLVCGGFLANGRGEDRGSRDALVYDRKARVWKEIARLNTDKAFFGAAVVDGQAYAVGGNIERYDEQHDRWEVICRDPGLPESHFSALAIDGKLLIVGHRLWIFDTSSQELTSKDPWPTRGPGDHFHLTAVLGGQLHVIGGLNGESYDALQEHWVWNGSNWERWADTPAPLFAKFAVTQVLNNELLILMGERSYRFVVATKTWRALAPMPRVLCMPGSIVTGDRIQILGGLAADQAAPFPFAYDWVHDCWGTADAPAR